MKIARVAFINTVQCGGSTTGATAGNVVGDRPGQAPYEIDLVEVQGMPCIRLAKNAAGKHFQTHVPIFNVSHFEPMDAEQLAALAKKDAELAVVAEKAKKDADALAEKAKQRGGGK